MAKMVCNKCSRNFEESEKFCSFCGGALSEISNGKGFAVFSMLLGILSCFYTFTYTGYFAVKILVALTMPDTYDYVYAVKDFIMEYGSFFLIIIAAVLSIVFSVIAANKGNKSKMSK